MCRMDEKMFLYDLILTFCAMCHLLCDGGVLAVAIKYIVIFKVVLAWFSSAHLLGL